MGGGLDKDLVRCTDGGDIELSGAAETFSSTVGSGRDDGTSRAICLSCTVSEKLVVAEGRWLVRVEVGVSEG